MLSGTIPLTRQGLPAGLITSRLKFVLTLVMKDPWVSLTVLLLGRRVPCLLLCRYGLLRLWYRQHGLAQFILLVIPPTLVVKCARL